MAASLEDVERKISAYEAALEVEQDPDARKLLLGILLELHKKTNNILVTQPGPCDLSLLLSPVTLVDVLRAKVDNTPRRLRSTLQALMQQHGIHGHIRRDTISTVAITAIIASTDQQAQAGLETFVRGLRAIAPVVADSFIADSSHTLPYMRVSLIRRVDVEKEPHIKAMYMNGVRVDKVAQATKAEYLDSSQVSSDPEDAVTTRSSMAGSDRGASPVSEG